MRGILRSAKTIAYQRARGKQLNGPWRMDSSIFHESILTMCSRERWHRRYVKSIEPMSGDSEYVLGGVGVCASRTHGKGIYAAP